MTLEEAYAAKGELITQLEISQMKLKSVNEFIQKELRRKSEEQRLIQLSNISMLEESRTNGECQKEAS